MYRWQEVERLRAERNAVANKMKGKLEPSVRQALVEEGNPFFFPSPFCISPRINVQYTKKKNAVKSSQDQAR